MVAGLDRGDADNWSGRKCIIVDLRWRLIDAVRWKRALVAVGIIMIGGAALILALRPTVLFVVVISIEQILQTINSQRRPGREVLPRNRVSLAAQYFGKAF